MKEEWKDIEGYEGLYQISNLGRIKSLTKINAIGRNLNEKMLKPTKDKDGYKVITLRKNNKNYYYKIHRLVATSFIPNIGDLPEVNHKDENKSNNDAKNLEWCTHKYNNSYGTKVARGVMNTDYNRIAKKNMKPIKQYDMNGVYIKVWEGINECGRLLGFDSSVIAKACKSKSRQAYGYKWEYATGEVMEC